MTNFNTQVFAEIREKCKIHKATLIAVSKKQSAKQIQAAQDANCIHFGENYIQELIEKKSIFGQSQVHFIGHLQSKKAEDAVKLADVIHTIDRVKLANQIEKACIKLNKSIEGFIQVNIGEEEQKSGVSAKELPNLISHIQAQCPHIHLTGLMCIPPRDNKAREHFKALKHLSELHSLPNLSMGMSSDWEIALEEGATHIRVGSALFGPRT